MTVEQQPQAALSINGANADARGDLLTPLLRALAESRCLEVFRLFADGVVDPAEISGRLGMPEPDVRRHLEAIEGAGLTAGSGNEAIALANQAVNLLAMAMNHRGEPLRVRPSWPEDAAVDSVLAPPLACTLCDNSGFVAGVIAELQGAVREAREYHRRIQEMSSQVLTAHEAERKRIARELHDDTAQAITSILVRLRLLERSSGDPAVLRNVEELRELTAGALDSVRRLAMDLRPAALDDLGLVPALQSYAEKFEQNWGIPAAVQVQGVTRRLPPAAELVLYRVLQEALANVAKHSGASLVEISLRRRNNQVTLTVTDNGRGFSGEGEPKPGNTGLGLFGMRERLALVRGELEIGSRSGGGTSIVARVPLGTTRSYRRAT
jgi:signal transduction histidine kinase